VAELTRVDETARPASLEDALELIRLAWDEVRRPDTQAPPVEIEDPLDAQSADMIEGRFLVVGRRGEGSSGIALAVLDDNSGDDKEVILKIARDDAAGRRLDVEAEVLRGIEHPRVVRLAETLELGGRRVLLMSDAGKETLATRLAKEGQSTLEQLQRWGTDLLEAMAYLVDTKGVFHRDIKPANLGIAPDPAYRKPHLTLFDFSLAREPLDNITSGTPGYLDPYLGKGRRSRYDRPAELWAVSATLFEMATGVLPWWPNGANAPASTTERPVVEPTSFDPAVGEPLAELFRKALSPDVKERFGNVEDLLRAWSGVFASLDLNEDALQKDEELASKATLETPLEQSGLSAQALSALRRLDGVVTVGDVLGVHPVKINGIRGLGETYRKEIQKRIKQWRTALRPTESAPGLNVSLGVDRVVDNLLERLPAADKPLVQGLLGLGDGSLWPTAAEVASSFQTTRERVTGVVDNAVAEWSKDKSFLAACSELNNIVANAGCVMTIQEAVGALLTLRGSTLDGAERSAYGTALVRAIIELDARSSRPVFVLRRRAGTKVDLLALSEDDDDSEDGPVAPPADLLTDLASELGSKADDLVIGGVVVASTAIAELRSVVGDLDGVGQWQVTDARLLRLAAAASQTAAVSGFHELYPRAMPVKEALEHAMRGKPGRSISQMAVQRTLSARFPHLTEPLPTAERLAALMRELYPELVYQNGIFELKSTALYTTGTVSTTQFAATPAAEISRKLAESFQRHAALTLTVAPKRYVLAERALASKFNIEVLDIAELVVSATREQIEKAGGIWSGLLRYDALDRDSKQWKALEGVVQGSVNPVWEERLSSHRPLLLTNAGPLVRYGMTSLLATLLDTGTKRPAARWLLVAKAGDARAPLLEGRSVPLGPSGWIDLPPDLTQLTYDETTELLQPSGDLS
jgi:serine/threonine protein kinase